MPLMQVFVSISDPRSDWQVRHDLSELLTVAMCAVLCSADEFSEIEAWAKERLDWLRVLQVLEHGIPSHDTFGRVFAELDPREFEAAFRRWAGQVLLALDSDTVVAIDGKTSRRSPTKADASPLHIVSVFATDIGLVLGQTENAEKSKEITSIQELVATLALEGCVVTIDAMGAQTSIARMIRDRCVEYLLCVKHDHPKLVESFLLAQAPVGDTLVPTSRNETGNDGHGRSEIRRCWAFDAVDRLYKADQWADLRVLRSSSACAPSPANVPESVATTPAPCQPTPRVSRAPCAVTGNWRAGSTGASISSSTRTNPPFAAASPPTTLPSFATS